MTFHVTAQRIQHYYESCDFDIEADNESEARAIAEDYARIFSDWVWEEDAEDDGEITVLNTYASVEDTKVNLSNTIKTDVYGITATHGTTTQKEKRKTGTMPVDR